MDPINSLSGDDVRAAYRLVAELRELGRNPLIWRARLVEWVYQQTGAISAVVGETALLEVGIGVDPISMVEERKGQAAPRAISREIGMLGGFSHLPAFMPIVYRCTGSFTALRCDLVGDQGWHEGRFAEALERTGIDDMVFSFQRLASAGIAHFMAFLQPWGGPRFTRRDAALLALVHGELAELWERHVTASEPMPNRLEQVYRGVISGLDGPEIADRLAIKPSTVHSHMIRLFKQLDVHSREELVRLHYERLPVTQRPMLSCELRPERPLRPSLADLFRG